MPRSRLAMLAAVVALLTLALWLFWHREPGPGNVTPQPVAGEPSPVPGTDPAATNASAATVGEDASSRIAATAGASATEGPRDELRVLARWPGPQPAAALQVCVRRTERGRPYAVIASGITDAQGLVTFVGVAAGTVQLLSERGDEQEVAVTGGLQEVTFELPAGVAVRGTVIDPTGAAVADAAVFVQTHHTDWSGCRQVTQTAADGTFAIDHVDPKRSLGAAARDFAPSKLVDLEAVDTSAPPVVIELQLQPGGGQLVGTVTDADGNAIAGAFVAVGKQPSHIDYRGGRATEAWTPRVATTDERGRYAFVGLGAGELPFAARAEGRGVWRTQVTITAGETTTQDVQLQTAAVVRGVVTSKDGAPIAGARIGIYDTAPRVPFLAGGQIDFDEIFDHVGDLSGEDGSFRVAGVTPGTAHAFAQLGGRRRDGTSVAYSREELQIAPGEEFVWNPIIEEGRAIAGVVLYGDGQPMPNVFVTLTDERSGLHHVQTNGRDGGFRFLNLDASTYQIQVQYWDAPKNTPQLQQTGLVPDQGRIELRAPYDKPVKLARGTVTGRIDDVGSRITNEAAAFVSLQSDKNWFREDGKVEGGVFSFKDVEPCRFRLVLMQGEAAIAQSDWFELQPAATLDVGALRTEPGGAARFVIERPEGTEHLEPTIYLRREGFARSSKLTPGRSAELTEDNLTPGVYTMTGHGTGLVSFHGAFEVVAGATSQVRLQLVAGSLCRVDVWFPEGAQPERYGYRFVDSAGKVGGEYEGTIGGHSLRPLTVSRHLPRGTWRLQFTSGELAGDVEFEVNGSGDEVTTRIDLR